MARRPRDERPLAAVHRPHLRHRRGHTRGAGRCSRAEIAALERKYALRLPESYALFLAAMGHAAGRLVDPLEFDFYYPAVLQMTERHRRIWAEDPAAGVELPGEGLLICGRHGQQFTYIVCDRPDDSAVWAVDVWDRIPRQVDESVFDFLESMRADAEHWIRSGMA